MTVAELVDVLIKTNRPNDIVKAFNGDSMQTEEVTGVTYDGGDHVVELHTDEP